MTEEEFRQQAAERGYAEPVEVSFEPGQDGDMHTHDFGVLGLVTRGTFTLGFETGPASFEAGQCCELEAGTMHSERTGSNGATVLIARK